MDNIPRLLFYLSGTLIISTTFTLFTSEILVKVGDPTGVGTAFAIGYAFVYFNIVFVVSRRFMRRLDGTSRIPYILAFICGLAPALWIFILEAGLLPGNQIFFALLCLGGSGLGAFLGHKAGLKAQVEFQEKLIEYLRNTGQLPDELKRPHDNLNKN